jgi:Predicted membrane protein
MSFTHFFSIKNIVVMFSPFSVNNYPFVMMVWNILLALAPFFIFLAFSQYWRETKFKKTKHKIFAAIIFFFWLIFLPNAPYLIADIRHLLDYCPENAPLNVCVSGAWEIMFFFVYSSFGWIFFVLYLNQMRALLAKIFNPRIAKIIIFAIIPLVALGVLYGLTERFNSWDFFAQPLAIFQNLLRYITSWQYFRNWLVFTAGYCILYLFGNLIFNKKIMR